MKRIGIAVVALVVATLSQSSSRGGTITEIVAFGDSLTDTGNGYLATGGTLPPSPPYFAGRSSNGPLYIERLAARLGIADPAPSLAGGTNYAFFGAETSLSGLSAFGTPNMGLQVGAYLAGNPTIGPGQLFVLYGGANDFLNAGQTDPSVPVANLGAEITILANAGATQFLIPNLPPLGSTPLAVGTPLSDPLNALSAGFNGLLSAELNSLQASLGVTIHRLDVFGLVEQAIHDPASFGFTNVTNSAFDATTGTVVPDPDAYFFWDAVHPTRAAHQILGDQAYLAAVPEPSTAVLLGLGLGPVGLLALARRRRAVGA